MGLFNLFYRQKGEKEEKESKKYKFSEEDREFSREIRERKKEIEMMKLERESELHKLKMEKMKLELQNEIDELKGVFDEEEEAPTGDNDTDMLKYLMPFITKFANPSQVTPSINNSEVITSPQPAKVLSNDELIAYWNNVPKPTKAYIVSLDNNNIYNILKEQFKGYSEDTYTRALEIIRSH